jgi:phosphatidylglycerophosphate synthase
MNRKEKRRIRRKKLKRIFTYANILSFSRILMAVPLVMALDGRLFDESIRNWACFGIILVIFLSDVLDGPLARWTDQVTNLGKIMDPVADKICMLVVLIFLIQDKDFGYLFFTFFMLITTRDTFLIITAVYLLQHQDEVFESLVSGKIFIFISMVMMILYVFPTPDYLRFMTYMLSILFFIISSYFYYQNFQESFKRIKGA